MPKPNLLHLPPRITGWSYHVGIFAMFAAYVITPAHYHALTTILKTIFPITLALPLFGKAPYMTRTQVIIACILTVTVVGYFCVTSWSSPLVVLIAPVFLFSLLGTIVILRTTTPTPAL